MDRVPGQDFREFGQGLAHCGLLFRSGDEQLLFLDFCAFLRQSAWPGPSLFAPLTPVPRVSRAIASLRSGLSCALCVLRGISFSRLLAGVQLGRKIIANIRISPIDSAYSLCEDMRDWKGILTVTSKGRVVL